jgi:hypothetical protein
VHSEIRDAASEATKKLTTVPEVPRNVARPPTARRWPRLEDLRIYEPDSAAIEALGAETWGVLYIFWLSYSYEPQKPALDATSVRAVAAVLRRMPALRTLKFSNAAISYAAAGELFGAAPRVDELLIVNAQLTLAAMRVLAATKWRLEALNMGYNRMGGARLTTLLAAPTFAIRRLSLRNCELDAADLLAIANAPGLLEELVLSLEDFGADAAGPALAALSRHVGLRKLVVRKCSITVAGFKALVEAGWPALTYLDAGGARLTFYGTHAPSAAAYARFPALEELHLFGTLVGLAGRRLLTSRRWTHLRKLDLTSGQIGDVGVTALERGE